MTKKTAKGAVAKPRQSKKAGRPEKVPDKHRRAAEYLGGGYQEAGDVVPSAAGLACYLGVSRSTVYKWAETDAQFSDMLEAVQANQERLLINKGLTGDFNATIAKLMLAKHDYSDKAEVDNKSSDGSMTPKPALDLSRLSAAAMDEIINARRDEARLRQD